MYSRSAKEPPGEPFTHKQDQSALSEGSRPRHVSQYPLFTLSLSDGTHVQL